MAPTQFIVVQDSQVAITIKKALKQKVLEAIKNKYWLVDLFSKFPPMQLN